MNYFTNELWEKFNSPDEEIRNLASNIWDLNSKLYNIEHEKVKGYLSDIALSRIIQNHGFHDWKLKEIIYLNLESEVKLVLEEDTDEWIIHYTDIKKIIISDYDKSAYDSLGYDELLLNDDETLSHEILFASGETIKIVFTGLDVYQKS